LNFVTPASITRRPWSALKIEDSSDPSHNVILNDHDRRAIRAAAHRDSEQFGLLIETLDETGARPSQAARLTAGNVQADFVDPRTRGRTPRLMMPVSRKGKGQKAVAHRPVPISEALAGKLAKVVKLRKRDDVLLHRGGGTPWTEVNMPWHFASAIAGVKFNTTEKVTMYALRHTSIVRQLLAGVPIAVVARLHDTGAAMIEKHYSEHIANISDSLARATLPATPKIVSLDDQRAKA
jgi:integrase